MYIYRTMFCVVTIGMLSGCTSFSATMLHRGEDNIGWKRERRLRGIPVTLKVKTHVRIDVIEKHFVTMMTRGEGDNKETVIVPVRSAHPIRQVTYTPIETEKIFLVDMKRPAAGTINAKIDLDPDTQYFKKIKNEVVDTTIDAVGDLIAQIAPGGLIGAPSVETTTAKPSAGFKDRIKEVSTIVASGVFEIDAPDFEIQVQQFLGRHLNCCHTCGLVLENAPKRNMRKNVWDIPKYKEPSVGSYEQRVPAARPVARFTPTFSEQR